MTHRHEKGFTLIELMVSLVVAGILMAGLVALSGSVQRSFGRSKEIVDLQARLRIGMIKLTDDLKRAAYMFTINPEGGDTDCGHRPAAWQGLSLAQRGAISYVNDVLSLRGNYISSRDYRVRLDYGRDQAIILCRDASPYNPEDDSCRVGVSSTAQGAFSRPFFDGPRFDDLFCENTIVRLTKGTNTCYYTVTNTTTTPFATLQFGEDLRGDLIQCSDVLSCFVNPITSIQYWMENQGPRGPVGAMRWALMRRTDDCASNQAGNPAVPVIENLLPLNDPHAPGLEIQVYVDTNYPKLGDPVPKKAPSVPPDIKLDQPIQLIPPGSGGVDWLQARALSVTMRGRTDTEDPNFVIHDYEANPAKAKNYGFDLDGVPENGLAHVRVAHMLVGLRNVTLKSHPIQRMTPAQ